VSGLARTSITQKARQIQNPTAGGVLQRQCACGQHANGGEYEACKQKREGTLQRAAINPASVHEVLRSPGQPLDAGTRAFMEPRFGRDFSQLPLHATTSARIQPKLIVNTPGDIYEQEADRVAEQVLAAPAHSVVSSAPLNIQRYAGQATEQMDAAPASVDQALASPGRPLEPALRRDMQQRFGHDFSRVRVHSGGSAEQSARDVNANAYTVGHNMVFGAGKFAPATHEGRHLIAHELAHVVQQSGADRIRLDQSDDKPGQSPIALKQPIVRLKCSACEKEEDNQLRRKESGDQPSNCGPGTTDPFCLGFPSPDAPCKPFPSVEQALSVWASLSNRVPSGAAAVTQCGEVKAVWDTYFAATSTPFPFSKPSSCVVSAAKTDPEGSAFANRNATFLHKSIIDNLPITLQGITPPPFPVTGSVTERRLPLEEAIAIRHRRRTFLHPDITYNDPFNAAANIAGGSGVNGKGSDVFGDDDREMSGTVIIEVATIDPASGMMAGQVRWQPHIHVKDTVDFCPGNLGNEAQKEFTIPMSKLESMGLTRDVPITIDYDLDVKQENFNNVRPLIGPPPPPRPTLPVPTLPISPPPQSDSQFRSRRFAGQPTLEACGKGKHRMLRGENDLEAVKKVQETLGEAGIPVKVDGVFGEKTEQAVAKFKREHSPQIVPSDGVVGPKTSHALDDVAIEHGQ